MQFVSVEGDGAHFEAVIVSAAFRGKNKVQQHQIVSALWVTACAKKFMRFRCRRTLPKTGPSGRPRGFNAWINWSSRAELR